MKKTFLLLITIAATINFVQAQNDWISYTINNKLSVKIPDQPVKADENTVYAIGKDTTVYIITTVDLFKTDHLDSAKLLISAPTIEFANNFKSSMLSAMPGYTLGDVSIGKWKGFTSYHMEGDNAGEKLKIHAFMIIIGSHIYSLMTMAPPNHSAVERDAFFNSLAFK